jgi:hypothetical protein
MVGIPELACRHTASYMKELTMLKGASRAEAFESGELSTTSSLENFEKYVQYSRSS